MTIDKVVNILVTITLVEMMVAVGLGVTFADLAAVARNGWLVVRTALANYVCVPAVTVGLLLWFHASPMAAAGFLILAVCPGAPYGPPFTAIARGNVPVAVGLMVILAASSAILAPILLHYLMPLVSGDEPLRVDGTRLAVTLLGTQLLPLCVGVGVRQWRPSVAERLQKPAYAASKVLNLAAVVLILVVQGHLLTEIRLRGYLGMLLLLLACWIVGWLLGWGGTAERRTMTVLTSLRNVGVGLVIATGTFPGTEAVTAVLVYGLIEVIGSLLLALAWGRVGVANELPGTQTTSPS